MEHDACTSQVNQNRCSHCIQVPLFRSALFQAITKRYDIQPWVTKDRSHLFKHLTWLSSTNIQKYFISIWALGSYTVFYYSQLGTGLSHNLPQTEDGRDQTQGLYQKSMYAITKQKPLCVYNNKK